MKKIFRTLPVIAVMTAVAACSDGIEEQNPDSPETGDKIRIEFTAENPDTGSSSAPAAETRTSIHIGDGTFVSRWDDGNEMTLLYGNTPAKATYSSATKKFSTQITPGSQNFHAFSPHIESSYSGSDFKIPFGNLRTQDGNNFNHRYDPLVTTATRTVDPATEELNFTLKRLTSILKFEISGGSDQVKALLLTADENHPIASARFNSSTDGTGSLDMSTQDEIPVTSNVIAMTFDEGTAPALNNLHAYFNLPEGQYESLKLDIITANDQIGSIDLSGLPEFAAGELYRLKRTTVPTFTEIEKPSFDWPGQDMDIPHEILDENGDMELDYPAVITINAPAGIAELYVDVVSPALNAMEIGRLDLFNETQLPIGINYSNLGLHCTTQIQYKKSTLFDITRLVPMIPLLKDGLGDLIYGDHAFNVTVVDLAGNTETQSLVFRCNKVECSASDLWANTATLSIHAIDPEAQSVSLNYKVKGTSDWHELTATAVDAANGKWEAAITADNVWSQGTNDSGHTIYIPNSNAGVFAQKTYEYELFVDDTLEETGTFKPEKYDGDVIESFTSGSTCFTKDSSKATFWGSGNNTFAPSLCTFSSPYAYMQGRKNSLIGILAPGNLFTGRFQFAWLQQTGTVEFGQKYTYTSRPTGLKLTYKAAFDVTGSGFYKKWEDSYHSSITSGQDQASIIVCIINWNARHNVASGNKAAPTGVWNPESLYGLSEAEKSGLIAYGVAYPDANANSDTLLNIPLNYYDKDAAAPDGNYTIIISCATSRYGDYLNGTENDLYVKDIEWIY